MNKATQIDKIIDSCAKTFPYANAFALLLDSSQKRLVTVAHTGAPCRHEGYHSLSLDASPVYQSILKKGRVDALCMRSVTPPVTQTEAVQCETAIGAPLLVGDNIVGLLILIPQDRSYALTPEDFSKLARLARIDAASWEEPESQQEPPAQTHSGAVAKLELDDNFKIVGLNKAATTLLGRNRATMLNTPFADLLLDHYERVYCTDKLRKTINAADMLFETRLHSGAYVDIYACLSNASPPTLELILRDVSRHKNALKEIRAARGDLTEALEHLSEGYLSVDDEWHVTYFNARAELLFDINREQILGHNLWDVIPGLEAPFLAQAEKCVEHDAAERIVGFVSGPNKWLEVDIRPSGGVVHFGVLDISDVVELEAELADSRALADTLLANDFDALLKLDEQGGICSFNQAAEAMFGYTRQEIMGKSIDLLLAPQGAHDISSFTQQYLHPNTHSSLLKLHHELSGKRKNGALFPVELKICDVPNTGPRAFVIEIHDLSERAYADSQIRSLAKFPEQSPNPVLRLASDGEITYANAASTALRQAWQYGEAGSLPPKIAAAFTAALATGHNQTTESNIDDRTYLLLFAPVADAGYVNVFASDITERVNAENQLRKHRDNLEKLVDERTRDLAIARDQAQQADRSKSAFLASMSHELRTPLNAIIGYTEMLLEDALELQKQEPAQDLGRVLAAARHLLELINDVLDLSKIEANRMELNIGDFPLDTVVNDVVATVTPLIEKKNNRLLLSNSQQTERMYSDATRLKQCLFNLLSNASKFTENGEIHLDVSTAAEVDGDWVIFRVRDTGIGMTEDQLQKVFQPFAQAEVSTAAKYGGTGLGLTISRRLCRMMGGDITVESQPGHGTCFTMCLPVRVSQPREQRASAH